jgi:hypothetical protein
MKKSKLIKTFASIFTLGTLTTSAVIMTTTACGSNKPTTSLKITGDSQIHMFSGIGEHNTNPYKVNTPASNKT